MFTWEALTNELKRQYHHKYGQKVRYLLLLTFVLLPVGSALLLGAGYAILLVLTYPILLPFIAVAAWASYTIWRVLQK